MQAIHLTAYGDPLQGLNHVEIAEPAAPGPNQVLIQVEYSPLNPSDFLLARGLYALHPELPSVIGNEGVGTVLALGAGVTKVKVGDRVLIPYGTFAWAQRVLAPADDLFVVPPGVDAQQASMLRINPPTAVLLLDEFVTLKPGDWLVQNAANSGVGRAVIAVARSRGLKTINIVRSQALVEELKAAGGDVVLFSGADTAQQARAATAGAPVRLGLDAVSGAATALLGEIVTQGSTIVSYAAMSGGAIAISPLDLIFKKIQLRGLFMYHDEYVPKLARGIAEGSRLIGEGKLRVPVAATYPLRAVKDAVQHALGGGKVLFDLRAA